MEEKIKDRMTRLLQQTFKPEHLEVTDESHRHHGHLPDRPQGESHFSVLIVSDQFHGLTQVQRHRLVYQCLKVDLKEHIHALALKTLTNAEFSVRQP